MQDGRLQVVDVDAVLADIEAEFVGGPVSDAGLDAALAYMRSYTDISCKNLGQEQK